MGVEELTTHDEQLISSSSLDVGVGIHSESWNQKSMAKVDCRARSTGERTY